MSLTTPFATTTVASSLSSLSMVTPSLTTTFVPTATTCTENRLTMLANRAWEIWMNVPVPVPNSTFSDCYPSQYMTSFLLSAGGVTQGLFNPLVCPENWSAVGPYTSNYIACCPSGYSLAQPASTVFSNRPAFGGTCYTPIYEATPVKVTAYGSDGVTATTLYTATTTNAQAYAYPMDGFAFGVQEVASTTPAATTGATSTAIGAKATHTVFADTNPVYTPTSVNASIGDTILFLFESGNHSATQSTFDNPCERLANGFDSGYMPNINNAANPIPQFTVNVTTNSSEWFYSKQGSECSSGMVFALNPSSTQTYASFRQNALNTAYSSSGTSTGVKVGASIGSIAGFFLILFLALYLYRRYLRKSMPSTLEDGTNHKTAMIGTTDSEWLTENKPDVLPKEAELHDQSIPGELSEMKDPVELHEGNRYGTPNEPVEMWSPSTTVVSRNFEGMDGAATGSPEKVKSAVAVSPERG